ncbi:MAG: hypothetical protein SPI71_04300 [Acidaminococcaceae bacterium]|nr:hypothetical protein [Acidaminococcaceae bacterium]
MWNILFALFLFGMLITLSIRIFRKALLEQQTISVQELALLVALSLGCLSALQAGVSAIYRTQLLFF